MCVSQVSWNVSCGTPSISCGHFSCAQLTIWWLWMWKGGSASCFLVSSSNTRFSFLKKHQNYCFEWTTAFNCSVPQNFVHKEESQTDDCICLANRTDLQPRQIHPHNPYHSRGKVHSEPSLAQHVLGLICCNFKLFCLLFLSSDIDINSVFINVLFTEK